jgi:hypothetical protein
MAAIKGVNQTKIDNGGIANLLAAGSKDGRKKVCIDTCDLAATQTGATDVLKLFGVLPKGAIILQIVLMQTGTQTSTIKVGTVYNDDEFLAASSTGIQTAYAVKVIPGYQYVVGTVDTDDQIIITFAGAVGATGTLYAEIDYTTD